MAVLTGVRRVEAVADLLVDLVEAEPAALGATQKAWIANMRGELPSVEALANRLATHLFYTRYDAVLLAEVGVVLDSFDCRRLIQHGLLLDLWKLSGAALEQVAKLGMRLVRRFSPAFFCTALPLYCTAAGVVLELGETEEK